MSQSLLEHANPVDGTPTFGFAEYQFDCRELADPFDVVAFEGVEAVNEPYRLSIQIRPEYEVTDGHALLGRDVALLIAVGGSERALRGIVDRVTIGQDEQRRPVFDIRVVPALASLDYTKNTRIFQDKTALEIVAQMLTEGLGPYGRAFQITSVDAGRLVTRNYCVQYRETNLAFVHRLLEEEGIGYYFDQQQEPEMLVLFDRNEGLVQGAPVRYDDTSAAGWDRLLWFPETTRRTATKLATRDYDWRRGSRGQLDAEGRVLEDARRPHEVYEHGVGDHHVIHEDTSLLLGMAETLVTSLVAANLPMPIADQIYDLKGSVFDAFSSSNTEDRGRVRRELHGRDVRTFEGGSTLTALSAGVRFGLTGHPTSSIDGDYYVTRIAHASKPPRPPGESNGATRFAHLNYHNRITCLPLATPWRPNRVTPKPRIEGVQTATVTGPMGLDVYTDPHGRIKVRFPWDRAETDFSGHYTCWLRVAQAWAGATAPAFLFIPRVGMEVVVSFIDGDPDRPLVTGCVYNGDNPSPALLPPQATKSIIRTRTVPMGNGYNELSFEDAMGMERVYLRAERDLAELVQNDHEVNILKNEAISIGGEQTEKIGLDQRVSVGRHSERTVGGHELTVTAGDHTHSVGGSRHERVDRSYYLEVGGAFSVEAPVGELIAGGRGVTLGAGKSMLRMTDEEQLKGHDKDKGLTLTSFGSMVHLSQDKIELTVGESKLEITPQKLEVVIGGSKLTVDAAQIQANAKTLPAGGGG